MPAGFAADGTTQASVDELLALHDTSLRRLLRAIVGVKGSGQLFVEVAMRDTREAAQLLDWLDHVAGVQPDFAQRHWYVYFATLLREMLRRKIEADCLAALQDGKDDGQRNPD